MSFAVRTLGVAALLLLGGCLTWTQTDPPPRDTWDRPGQDCDAEWSPAIAAGILSGVAGGGSAVIFATTERSEGGLPGPDFEERIWAGLLIPVSIGYAIDAIIAFSDAAACRDYRAWHAKGRAGTRPEPVPKRLKP